MDRTAARRIFNEFTTEIDINRPDGILRSGDVDKYIENALKPLIEEGKAFKRVSVNRNAGIRSTRYAYQGGKNIQDSINAILAEMLPSLGYDVDSVTGNVSGTNRPPPVSVMNQGRHYYNETRERILDPRTAAAIRADALRAGGVASTDKASGYTTTLLRAGLSGETRRMRKLVNDTDVKYLAGELPSSALADGASPATIEERARAQVARQANLKDAKQAAIEDYIRAHPDSQLAIEEALMTQKVTNRDEKARLLEAERTPGTPEFRARVATSLGNRVARDDAMLQWAKQNKRNRLARPLAKQILKARRRKTFVGRALEKSKSVVKATAIGAIVGAISAAVATAVKFLSGLPGLAADVHKIASKGASLGVTDERLRAFESLEGRLGGLEKGAVGSYLGTMHSQLSDVATGGNLDQTLSRIAPLLSKVSNGADLSRRIAYYAAGQDTDTNGLGKDLLNAVLTVSLQGRTLYKDGLKPSDALRFNAVTYGRALGGDGIMNSIAAALQNRELISADTLQQIQNIANGASGTVGGQTFAGGQVFDAIVAAIDGGKDILKPRDTATAVEWKAADEVAAQWRNLAAAFQEIKAGVLAAIAATLSSILSWVEVITKGVLSLPGLKGRFDDVVRGMDERTYYKNLEHVKSLDTITTVGAQVALSLAERNGFITIPDAEKYDAVSLASRKMAALEQAGDKFYAGREGIPREVIEGGKLGEYVEYMLAVRSLWDAQNELAFGQAQNTGFENPGEEVSYRIRGKDGKRKTGTYTYEVGNVKELSNATAMQNMVKVRNDTIDALGPFTRRVKDFESDDGLFDKLKGFLAERYYGGIEEEIANGGHISPADYSNLQSYRNAKAYAEYLANDGMSFGNARPDGQADKNVRGEASVLTGRLLRTSQETMAQVNTIMHEIRAQIGENAFAGVMENRLNVSGVIEAEDRTYTIILTDRATGKEVGRAVDVQRVTGHMTPFNVQAAMEALQPTQ
jgi:hypothetical protein